jgi:hypothetical protein
VKHDPEWYVRDELCECLRLAMLQWKRHAALNPSDINPAMWSRCSQALSDAQSRIKLAAEH